MNNNSCLITMKLSGELAMQVMNKNKNYKIILINMFSF